jgi:putative ABC transport system permease protein
MVYNIFLTALRNLRKNIFFSALNILGLAIGMAVFLLIAQYVKFENSYENFVPAKENLYRLKLETYRDNKLIAATSETFAGAGQAIKNELPEVTSYFRLSNFGYKNNVVITNENAKPEQIAFKQKRFLYADPAFLDEMGYSLTAGNSKTALAEPLSAVISDSYAKMYFAKEDPIGKTLHLHDDDGNDELVKVTGVFKEVPQNTHLKFDVLFSYKTLYGHYKGASEFYEKDWNRPYVYTFIRLRPGTDQKKFETKLAAIVGKYKPEQNKGHEKNILSLQRVKDIHLTSDLDSEAEPNGNRQTVLFLGLIGIFVLVIAWINYVNLSTARALERAKEVGIRKVSGAVKYQLIGQFLAETALVNLFSILIAWGLTTLSLNYFNSLSGLSLSKAYLVRPWFINLLLLLWLAGSFLSGLYPAFVLSSFRPIVVLKGKLKSNNRGILLRKSLVVMQFMASIILIAGTVIVYRQLNFMTHRDLGMNIDQVLVTERPGFTPRDRTASQLQIDVFTNELKKDPTIANISSSLTVPGKQREYKVTVKKYGDMVGDSIVVRVNSMDYNFLDVFKMKLVAGRNFSPDFPRDEDTSLIISETAARMLGFKKPEDALGHTITVQQFRWSPIVVGVVNDYHQVSFKKTLDPSVFYCTKYGGEFYSMRVRTNDLTKTLKHAQQSWAKSFPGNPFEYFFLDDYFNRQYQGERRFGKLFTAFAALAIMIGCLGLFGLSAYTASLRIKEIGIRKVLGASVPDITAMLSKDFLKLVCLAILLASPLAWWIMHNWLQDFAYRVNISWWVFVAAGGIALFIAVITVSFQAIKAAVANPVKSLRTE